LPWRAVLQWKSRMAGCCHSLDFDLSMATKDVRIALNDLQMATTNLEIATNN